MMNWRTPSIFGAIVAIVAACSVAGAQEQPALGGIIRTSDGKPLRGATVRILGTSPARGAISQQDGTFLICGIQGGEYDIRISAVGFRDTTIRCFISFDQATLVPDIMIAKMSAEEMKQVTTCTPIAQSEKMGTRRSIIFDSWGRVGRTDR